MEKTELFRQTAIEKGLCQEYKERWEKIRNKKQFIDMGLSIQGMDYFAAAYAQGWGMSAEYLVKTFEKFINGNYVSEQNGYNTAAFVKYQAEHTISETALLCIDVNMKLNIPEYCTCEVLVTGRSRIVVNGKGGIKFVCYGNDDIEIIGMTDKMKRINKLQADGYEQ